MSNIPFELRGGKILTKTLEYNVIEHCNLRCHLCDHSSPLVSTHAVSPEEFEHDISQLATVLRASEFKLIGGEPLLHRDLLHLVQKVRQIGIADTITVATNGLLLHTMDEEFWLAIDRLWLSLYPGIKLAMPTEELERHSRHFGFRLDIFAMHSFRHTTLSSPVGPPGLVRAIFNSCELPHINYCHTLRHGIYYKCSPAPFSKTRLGKLGIEYDGPDGVAIHHNPALLRDLSAYLSCDEPLPACSFCLGSSGRWFPHEQMTSQEISMSSVQRQPSEDATQLIDWNKLDIMKEK